MRKNLVVGILRETRENERRTPLIPVDVRWLVKRGIQVEIETDNKRVFTDQEYQKNGAKILNKLSKATFLLGIKEPRIEDLQKNKIYMVFSHTTKGQRKNMPLLRACLKKKITLLDYEKIVDLHGRRLVYFGRFAGICGIVDSLHYLGKKMEYRGIKTPFLLIEPAYRYNSLKAIKKVFSRVDREIAEKGFSRKISPFIVGITGHGNVSRGVQEILELLNPMEIHPRDMKSFIRHQKEVRRRLFKIVFLREEKFRSINGKGFYFEEYLKNPKKFESNMDNYLSYLNIFIHTRYWDNRYPRMVTKKMVNQLARKKPFRLEFIGDISCDINGSIELTYKVTDLDNSTFTYIPRKGEFVDGYKAEGIAVLARDNLPVELPRDSSEDFSSLIKDYVYQIAAHGVRDITNHIALPREVREAVITQKGKLAKNFTYLKKYVDVDFVDIF